MEEASNKVQHDSPLENLPTEIMRLILLFLPVNSLLHLRCVNSSWCFFVSLHLKRRIVFLPFSKEQLVNNETQFLSLDDGFAPIETLHIGDSLLSEFNTSVKIFGFCNGLVCLLLDMDRLALWSPSTSEYKMLPKPSNTFRGGVFYGMGYDSSSDDYKLVRAAASRFKDDNHGLVRIKSPIKFEVFTGKSNSWRRIRDMGTIECCLQKQAVHLRGSLFWLMQMYSPLDEDSDAFKDIIILSFNLGNEKVHKVSPPDEGWKIIQCRMGVLGGRLCVCSCNESCVSVWVMKTYNKKAYWSKVITMIGPTFSAYVMPICVTRKGEAVMLVNGKDLVVYDFKEGSYTNVVVGGSADSFSAAFYVESLVRLNYE